MTITLTDAADAVLSRTRKVFSSCRADVAQVRPAASRQSSPWLSWWKVGGQRDTLVASTRDPEYPGRKLETGGLSLSSDSDILSHIVRHVSFVLRGATRQFLYYEKSKRRATTRCSSIQVIYRLHQACSTFSYSKITR